MTMCTEITLRYQNTQTTLTLNVIYCRHTMNLKFTVEILLALFVLFNSLLILTTFKAFVCKYFSQHLQMIIYLDLCSYDIRHYFYTIFSILIIEHCVQSMFCIFLFQTDTS